MNDKQITAELNETVNRIIKRLFNFPLDFMTLAAACLNAASGVYAYMLGDMGTAERLLKAMMKAADDEAREIAAERGDLDKMTTESAK